MDDFDFSFANRLGKLLFSLSLNYVRIIISCCCFSPSSNRLCSNQLLQDHSPCHQVILQAEKCFYFNSLCGDTELRGRGARSSLGRRGSALERTHSFHLSNHTERKLKLDLQISKSTGEGIFSFNAKSGKYIIKTLPYIKGLAVKREYATKV